MACECEYKGKDRLLKKKKKKKRAYRYIIHTYYIYIPLLLLLLRPKGKRRKYIQTKKPRDPVSFVVFKSSAFMYGTKGINNSVSTRHVYMYIYIFIPFIYKESSHEWKKVQKAYSFRAILIFSRFSYLICMQKNIK